MSGPMHWFRKHQKVMLIVVGVSMALFLIGSAVTQNLGQTGRQSAGPGQNEVVVSWEGGKLTRARLDQLRRGRRWAFRFHQKLAEVVVVKFKEQPNFGSRIVSESDSDQELLQRELLAQEAEELGIIVSDEAIEAYLHNFSGEITQAGDYDAILREHFRGFSLEHLYSVLRREMLAVEMYKISRNGLASSAPLNAFQYHEKLTRQIQAEVMPIAVEKFMDKVGEPTEEQIQDLYEKHKDHYSDPNSPDPGFRMRDQIQLETVQGSFDDFLAIEEAKVTQEEIAAYYEEHRDNYRKPELPSAVPNALPGPPDPDYVSPVAPSEPESDTTEPTIDLPLSDPEEGAATDPVTDSETDPATEPSSEEEASEEEAGDEDATEATDGTDPVEEAPLPDASEQGSLSPREVPASYATFQDDEAPSSDANSVEDPSPTEEEDLAEGEPSEEESTEEEPSAEELPSSEELVEDPAGSDSPPLPGPPSPDNGLEEFVPAEPQYKTLEEVADDIRTTIATPLARTALTDAMASINGKMEAYAVEYSNWRIDHTEDSGENKPTVPDLETLCDSLGLTYLKTPLLDRIQLSDNPTVGKSFYQVNVQLHSSIPPQPQTFRIINKVYSADFKEYSPFPTENPGNLFISWKIDEKEEYTPDLEEVRDAVIHAWKMEQALEKAKEKGEFYAAQVRSNHSTLALEFADIDSLAPADTNLFTWLMVPGRQGEPQYSDVKSVEKPGDEFMEAVFDLHLNDVGTAVNADHSIVYVVRITNDPHSLDFLRQQFLDQGLTQSIRLLLNDESEQLWLNWYLQLEESHKVEWLGTRLPASEQRN